MTTLIIKSPNSSVTALIPSDNQLDLTTIKQLTPPSLGQQQCMGQNVMKKRNKLTHTGKSINMPNVNSKDIKDVYNNSAPEQRNRMIAGGLAAGGFVALLKFLIKLI